VLGARGIDGGVVEAGAEVRAEVGDLVVERLDRRVVVRDATPGPFRPATASALLHGAGDARGLVQALLDRCAVAESGEGA
jgi:hypothetical protein